MPCLRDEWRKHASCVACVREGNKMRANDAMLVTVSDFSTDSKFVIVNSCLIADGRCSNHTVLGRVMMTIKIKYITVYSFI